MDFTDVFVEVIFASKSIASRASTPFMRAVHHMILRMVN